MDDTVIPLKWNGIIVKSVPDIYTPLPPSSCLYPKRTLVFVSSSPARHRTVSSIFEKLWQAEIQRVYVPEMNRQLM